MDKEYIVGLDGGGTKSDCVLLDTDGRFVDYLKWGTTSRVSSGGNAGAGNRTGENVCGAF